MSVITGISAGRLDRRITIQSALIAQSSSGEPITTYSTLASLWGEVRTPSLREIQAASQTVGQIDRMVIVRFRTDITQTSRVLFDDGMGERAHEILGPPEELGRRTGLRLRCRVLRST